MVRETAPTSRARANAQLVIDRARAPVAHGLRNAVIVASSSPIGPVITITLSSPTALRLDPISAKADKPVATDLSIRLAWHRLFAICARTAHRPTVNARHSLMKG